MTDSSRELRTDFTGDADSLVGAAKDAEKAFDRTADASKDLGKQAGITDADIDAMADALHKSIKDSESAKDSLKKMREEIKRLGDDAPAETKKVSKGLHDVADDAAEAGKEAGQEFRQNLGESVASGDMSSIVQDTLGGLVSGLGPVLGTAAAGVGLIVTGVFGKFQKDAEALAELVESRASLLRERFGLVSDEIDRAFKQDQLESWVTDNIDALQKIRGPLEQLGIDASDYATAIFEGGDAYEAQIGQLRGIMDAHGHLEGPIGHQKIVYDETGLAAETILKNAMGFGPAIKDSNDELVTFNEFTDAAEANLQGAVEAAAAVGTGNTHLDDLLQKAKDLGWYALTAQEQAELIGSGNTALAGVVTAAEDLETATANANTNMKQFPDPGLPKTKSDAEDAREAVREIRSGANYGGGTNRGGTARPGRSAGGQAAAPAQQSEAGTVPAPVTVTNNWNVQIRDSVDPDRTVKALRRAVRDNGDRQAARVSGL